jgi:hypothetical protein
VVLLETEDSSYWRSWERFVTEEVAARGLIGSEDHHFYRIVASVTDAAAEVLGFYRNYHSVRWVGQTLVLRLLSMPSRSEVELLSRRFSDICDGPIRRLEGPLPAERRSDDHLELARLALRFDRVSYARLRQLIDELNCLPSAPPHPLTGRSA